MIGRVSGYRVQVNGPGCILHSLKETQQLKRKDVELDFKLGTTQESSPDTANLFLNSE